MTGQGGDESRVLRVLHVEDNAGDVRLVAEGLKESGVPHEAYVVNDGFQAFEFLRRKGSFSDAPRPDLVWLDLILPRRGGERFWPI